VTKENSKEQFDMTGKMTQTIEDLEDMEKRRKQKLRLAIERYYLKKGVIPQTTPEYYRYGEVLGKGAFGKVILGVHVLTGLKVAIKMIEKTYMQEERRRRKVFQEILAMRSIKSPYILPLYEVFESTNHLLLVIEYAPGGDLLHYVKNKGKLTEAEAAYMLRQLVEGLKACHARNIIHRDVKLDNILLDSTKTKVKLCDFGVCRALKKGDLINEHCGTPAYLAPEIIANVDYDGYCVDLWSLGVTLYAMVTGTLPFKAKNLPDLQKAILKGAFELPSHLTSQCCSLLRGLMQLVPRQRLNLDQVSDHPWLAYEAPADQRPPAGINDVVLESLKTLGFSRKAAVQSLKLKEMNHVTATYAILEHYL
jgi:serine/threonine protein kinase